MKKLFSYLKPYLLWTILAPILMMLEVVMDLFQPMLMQKIVDVGITNGDMDYVLKTLAIMLGVAVIGYIGGVGCSIYSSKAAIHAGTDIRNDLFEKVQTLSFGNIDRLETGNLITRLTNDVVQVQRVMMMMLRVMVRSPLQIIGSLIMTYIISPKLFLILLVITPILILSLVLIMKKGFPMYSSVQKKLDKVNTVMQENLSGIRVVKAFVRDDFEIKRFARSNDDLMETNLKVARLMSIITPITMVLLNLGVIAVIWFGGKEVYVGNLQVGKVMAFINYLLQLLYSLMSVAGLLMMYSRAQASAKRITEVLESVPDIVDDKDALEIERLEGDLVFDNVSFRYGDEEEEPVLNNISFTAKRGEKVAILGATGSGKSSLVNLVPRLYDIESGSITIGGIDIRRMTQKSLRNNIGMVLQQTILFSGSIIDNLRYGKEDATDDEIIRVTEVVQAKGFIEGFTNQFETTLGQKGVNLSGGQKQRIAIARGLIRKPAILILDDSTSAVDVATEAIIQKELKENIKDTIVLLVAQRISSVLDADQIIVLEDGCMVAKGSHSELMKTSDVYRDIYSSQLGKEDE